MEAAINGHDTCVQLLLTFAPDVGGVRGGQKLLDDADVDGNTALHFASANGHRDVLRTLMAAGADAERRNGWSWSAVNYSLTVQAEVFFKGLIQEYEEIRRVRSNTLERGTGGGVRIVGDSD